MRFTLTIKMDNAAFEPDAGWELSRILRQVAVHIERGDTTRKMNDSNGNHVGDCRVIGKPKNRR